MRRRSMLPHGLIRKLFIIFCISLTSCTSHLPRLPLAREVSLGDDEVIVRILASSVRMARGMGNQPACYSYRPYQTQDKYVVTMMREPLSEKLTCPTNKSMEAIFDQNGDFLLFTPIR